MRMVSGLALAATMSGVIGAAEVAAQMTGSAGVVSYITGKIAALDLQRSALKLEAAKPAEGKTAKAATPPSTFMLDEQTVIRKGGQSLKPEQLKVGDRVRLGFVAQEDKYIVKSITVQEAGASEKAQPGEQPGGGLQEPRTQPSTPQERSR